MRLFRGASGPAAGPALERVAGTAMAALDQPPAERRIMLAQAAADLALIED